MSDINITEGSGKIVETKTISSKERQVVVLGDPTTVGGVAPVDAINGLAVDVKAFTGAITVADIQSGSISIRDISGGTINIRDNGGSITVDGSVAVSSITGALTISDIQGGTIVIKDITGGTVNIKDNGGSITIDGILTGIANTVFVQGDVIHDSVDSGNPVKIGGKAYNQDGTVPGTAVAEGDRANFISDVYGRQFVATEHPYFFNSTTSFASSITNATLVVSPGAGLSLYLTDIIVSVSDIGNTIRIVEDTNSPVIKINNKSFAPNGGMVVNFKTPIKFTANKNLGLNSWGIGSTSMEINGYIAP